MRRAVALVAFLSGAHLFASPLDDYNDGVEAYRREDFPKAESAFEKAARDEKLKERSLFNLGNARARQGRLGDAIDAYQEALSLEPSKKRVQENLEWAKKLKEQEPPPDKQNSGPSHNDQPSSEAGQNQPQAEQKSDPTTQSDQERPSKDDQEAPNPKNKESQNSSDPQNSGSAPQKRGELSPEDAERMIDAVPERTGVGSDRQKGGRRGGSTLDW